VKPDAEAQLTVCISQQVYWHEFDTG